MHVVEMSSPPLYRVEPLLLVQEISHRVINEYSQAIAGIRLAARGVASKEARAILGAAATRLLSYAEAHRALQVPQSNGTADLADYLDRLCATMTIARLQERGVQLTLSADSITITAERCWRVALIVSELITNSLRHGLQNGPGSIQVEVEVGDETTVCRVIDDGCGSSSVKPGRGFDVVTGLASEIGGGIGWCFGPDGTKAELSFPNAPQEHLA